jgi:hypothetical protein
VTAWRTVMPVRVDCGREARRVRRGLLVVSVVALALVPAGDAASRISSADALRACAHGRSVGVAFAGSDLGYLRRFVPCVVKQLRSQLGLRMKSSAKLSRVVADELALLARSRAKDVNAAVHAAGETIVARVCPARGVFADNVGDTTPPPVLTPRVVASGVARYLFGRNRSRVERRSTVFGFAFRRGDLFHDGPSRGKISLFVYALYCPEPLR